MEPNGNPLFTDAPDTGQTVTPTAPPAVSNEPVDSPTPVSPAPTAPDDDPYMYVRTPDGQVRAVLKSSIVDSPMTATSDAPATVQEVKPPVHFYVWLANGDVVRVAEPDLPGASGAANPFGHWQRGNDVFQIVGVYPVEDTIPEGK